jgi:hypothetical protein
MVPYLRALFFFALIAPIRPSFAQGAEKAKAGEKDKTAIQGEAIKHNEAGIKYYKEKKYGKAIEEFEASYKLLPDPSILYNIARCHHHMGNLPKAVEYYEKYTASPEAPNVDKALAYIEEIKSTMALVKITSDPDGAEVYVGGKMSPECKTPDAILLEPGKHTISLKLEGHKEASRKIEVQGGKKYEFNFKMKKTAVEETGLQTGPPVPGSRVKAEKKIEKKGRKANLAFFTDIGAGCAVSLYFPDFDPVYPDVILMAGAETRYITAGARFSLQPWNDVIIYDAGLVMGKHVRILKKLEIYAGAQIGVMIMNLRKDRMHEKYTLARGTGWDLSAAVEAAVAYNVWKPLWLVFSAIYLRMYPSAGNIDKKLSLQYAPSIRLSAKF